MDVRMVRQLLHLPELVDVKNLLVIEPHPDDNEVGAGATIRLLANKGAKITYITVTDGRLGSMDTELSADTVAGVRKQERQRASELVGVTASYFLEFEDGADWSEHQLMKRLVPLIREVRPDAVMTVDPWTPYESHPDHVKTGRSVATALIYARNGVAQRGQGEPYDVPQIAFYGSAYPNTFVDVSQTWDTKLQAMKAHTSQFDGPDWPLVSGFLTEQAHQYYQSHYGDNPSGYAEAFKVLASMQLHFFPEAVQS